MSLQSDFKELKQATLQHFQDDKVTFTEMNQAHKDMIKSINELKNTIAPMSKWFEQLTIGKKMILKLLGFIALLAGIFASIAIIFRRGL